MRSVTRLALTLSCGAVLLGGAPAALAQTADYNGGTDADVLDRVVTPPGQGAGTPADDTRVADTRAGTPTTLPFTGGEVVLLAATGAAAVAAGAALFAGGRRRSGADA